MNFYVLTRRADGREWSGLYANDVVAVWSLAESADALLRVAREDEKSGAFVLRRFESDDGQRGNLLKTVEIVSVPVESANRSGAPTRVLDTLAD